MKLITVIFGSVFLVCLDGILIKTANLSLLEAASICALAMAAAALLSLAFSILTQYKD